MDGRELLPLPLPYIILHEKFMKNDELVHRCRLLAAAFGRKSRKRKVVAAAEAGDGTSVSRVGRKGI
jgi:hypothetical protein